METIELVELVIQADSPDTVERALEEWIDPAVGEADDPSTASISGVLPNGLPLRALVARPDSFGTTLWKHTGSAEHIDTFIDRFGAPAMHGEEDAVYSAAGLEPVPPELREGTDELDLAHRNELPQLIIVENLKGTLHNHSTYSDGAHTLEQMAETARSMGLSYFGICDHSRSLVIANGLSIEEVGRQQKEIDELNRRFETDGSAPFRIFSGIESDILADGSLDYPDEVLANFDLVVASVHIRLNMNVEEATERVLRAVRNPYTTILGHPTGRILLVREGYPLHYERVLDACAENNVAIELNANPYRLDLDWRWVRSATDRGILISINPDAHSMDGLKDMYWGVQAARKGWLTAEMCLNAKPLDAFSAWLKERRTS